MSAAEVLAQHRYGLASCDGCAKAYPRPAVHAQHQIDALKAAGYAVIELPKPGPLSDHHHDGDRVWYFDQDGEFVLTDVGDLWDTEGVGWTSDRLRDMAGAALAAAERADSERAS